MEFCGQIHSYLCSDYEGESNSLSAMSLTISNDQEVNFAYMKIEHVYALAWEWVLKLNIYQVKSLYTNASKVSKYALHVINEWKKNTRNKQESSPKYVPNPPQIDQSYKESSILLGFGL